MSQGSEKRARTATLTVRVSNEERATIDQAAERAGLMIGSYARKVLLEAPAPRQVRRPPVERRELVRLLAELGKIGSNINQLARAVNTGELIGAPALEEDLNGLRILRDAILRALGRAP